MSLLDDRERAIRAGLRREKRRRWQHVREMMRSPELMAWWIEHFTEPDRHAWAYSFGVKKPGSHLARHVRIEIHYMTRSEDRQIALEGMFAYDGE